VDDFLDQIQPAVAMDLFEPQYACGAWAVTYRAGGRRGCEAHTAERVGESDKVARSLTA
jgi:hypothetical protein